MKKGQVYEGIVARVDFPNKGIVEVGEETAVVKNSLPGQKVKFSVNKVRKGKAEGRLLEVIEKSPLETGRPCSHFGLCGGCNYRTLPYEEQLALKESQVKRLLENVLSRQGEDFCWDGIKGSPVEYGYRNKMEFTFGDEYLGGPLALGLHKRGSFYDIVPVRDCEIVDGDYRLIRSAVEDYFAAKGVSFFHRLTHQGYLRHLLVRKASGTGEILVALVTTSQDPWGNCNCPENRMAGEQNPESLISGFLDCLLCLQEEGKLAGSYAGILHIINDSLADVVRSDETRILWGKDYFYEELLGLQFKISTFSFFQTNAYGAAVLYETAREYIGDLGGNDKTVYDLYSGTGTIAQMMAPAAAKVIGVEIVEEAVEAAKENAAQNGLTNCEFIAGDVLKVLDDLTDKPDVVILDPPRDGIHPKAITKIATSIGAGRMIYISCKPTSLARDLELLLDYGYKVVRGCCVDMFPGTHHVETVTLLERVNN